jgi:hypothetical protein
MRISSMILMAALLVGATAPVFAEDKPATGTGQVDPGCEGQTDRKVAVDRAEDGASTEKKEETKSGEGR